MDNVTDFRALSARKPLRSPLCGLLEGCDQTLRLFESTLPDKVRIFLVRVEVLGFRVYAGGVRG
jgi:hypothetical protein